jgi:primary-amine oxidase
MPTEKMVVSLKPVNFFSRNPGIDVKPSRQDDNRSVLITDVEPTEGNCCRKIEGIKAKL